MSERWSRRRAYAAWAVAALLEWGVLILAANL